MRDAVFNYLSEELFSGSGSHRKTFNITLSSGLSISDVSVVVITKDDVVFLQLSKSTYITYVDVADVVMIEGAN
jgi:uncharacterized spore protein YtfJ